MLPHEENELICRTGPGTPMGELFRRFWLPIALAEELPGPDCDLSRCRFSANISSCAGIPRGALAWWMLIAPIVARPDSGHLHSCR
jgi:hypothetical protein